MAWDRVKQVWHGGAGEEGKASMAWKGRGKGKRHGVGRNAHVAPRKQQQPGNGETPTLPLGYTSGSTQSLGLLKPTEFQILLRGNGAYGNIF